MWSHQQIQGTTNKDKSNSHQVRNVEQSIQGSYGHPAGYWCHKGGIKGEIWQHNVGCGKIHGTSSLNSWWPSDTIWWHWSESTLAQVMAFCLTAPSHYQNQCSYIINEVIRHPHNSYFTSTHQLYLWRVWRLHFKNYYHIPQAQWVNLQMQH